MELFTYIKMDLALNNLQMLIKHKQTNSHNLKEIPFYFMRRWNFHMIDNLSVAVDVFATRTLTSLLVDKILLLVYMNLLSTKYAAVIPIMGCMPHD